MHDASEFAADGAETSAEPSSQQVQQVPRQDGLELLQGSAYMDPLHALVLDVASSSIVTMYVKHHANLDKALCACKHTVICSAFRPGDAKLHYECKSETKILGTANSRIP